MATVLSLCYIVLLLNVDVAKALLADTFFWKPRLRLVFNKPPTKRPVHEPTKHNIAEELVVIINGYSFGTTVLALLASYYAQTKPFYHLSPLHAHFYTNAYRWGLRHVSLLPGWMGGSSGPYPETHKVWNRRYHYLDSFVPKWMRYMVPWVKEKEWKQEELDFEQYQRFAEPAFGKHNTFPSKTRPTKQQWKSQLTKETVENLDDEYPQL